MGAGRPLVEGAALLLQRCTSAAESTKVHAHLPCTLHGMHPGPTRLPAPLHLEADLSDTQSQSWRGATASTVYPSLNCLDPLQTAETGQHCALGPAEPRRPCRPKTTVASKRTAVILSVSGSPCGGLHRDLPKAFGRFAIGSSCSVQSHNPSDAKPPASTRDQPAAAPTVGGPGPAAAGSWSR